MPLTLHSEVPPLHDVDGALRVGPSHVTLETVLWTFQQGSTPEGIVDEYPSLALADVYAVIAYYLRHREQVDTYLDDRERTYRSTVGIVQRDFPQPDFRSRRRPPDAC